MRIDLPDVHFEIGVDQLVPHPARSVWLVTISLGGVELISRQFTNDREKAVAYRNKHDGAYPWWYAPTERDAKTACTELLGYELKRALSAGSAMTPIGGTE